MTTTLAPDFEIKRAGMLWFHDWQVIRNGLPVCACEFRKDAERIAYCLRIVEESEDSERRRG